MKQRSLQFVRVHLRFSYFNIPPAQVVSCLLRGAVIYLLTSTRVPVNHVVVELVSRHLATWQKSIVLGSETF